MVSESHYILYYIVHICVCVCVLYPVASVCMYMCVAMLSISGGRIGLKEMFTLNWTVLNMYTKKSRPCCNM